MRWKRRTPTCRGCSYQVSRQGHAASSSGNEVDFKNTIILLTSNVGTDTIARACAAGKKRPDPAGLQEAMRADLLKAFKPALLGRMKIVPYYPLDDATLRSIIKLQLGRIASRIRAQPSRLVHYDDAAIEADGCSLQGSGKRRATWATSSPAPCCRRSRKSSDAHGRRQRHRTAPCGRHRSGGFRVHGGARKCRGSFWWQSSK